MDCHGQPGRGDLVDLHGEIHGLGDVLTTPAFAIAIALHEDRRVGGQDAVIDQLDVAHGQ